MMQLPRGAFRDLKKGIHLESLLQGMKEASFSGYCKIVTGEASALLVLKRGMIILAQSGDFQGDAALSTINLWGDTKVDAALHDLNTTQLQLTIEFNPSAQVKDMVKPPFSRQPVPQETARVSPEPVKKQEVSMPVTTPPPQDSVVAPQDAIRTKDQGTDQKGDNASSLLLQELDALDEMDIESITQKFRESCRQIIEKLELEYLLDSEKPKGGS
jgi:hypothetical protein